MTFNVVQKSRRSDVSLHYATTQVGRIRHHGREELPTHLKLNRHFQAARASRLTRRLLENLNDNRLLPESAVCCERHCLSCLWQLAVNYLL